ncbi:putative Rieske 2Fe-2S iron-sulfur protein YhfW [Cyphellophora attinorum]|uniref:Putative Rieske 2Fe-2S iron-sulfur protein YhfW n=1 Tax=Cyphellophora attinorum TaxID=1664694 RepID=A0A0N0NQQ9_9EURO|nr:putative Rieske 2Fe-2S iron-sulfur protein YhfW [Phialophora attinorum]KPI43979.1 putative Rieske 2Fe-2S iron-sulfur protein YhfW [Phialophora attinorum]
MSANFMDTSGASEPVWIHTEPYSKRVTFPQLSKDLDVDTCIIGSGIAGISTAYELVRQGKEVAVIEARNALSGESGRTSGHLASNLDDGYMAIAKKFGNDGARTAAESHDWGIQRVGEISRELKIDCEYRVLKGITVSQFEVGTTDHKNDVVTLKKETTLAKELGLDANFDAEVRIGGWDGKPDQRGGGVYVPQGILGWLDQQPNFQGYSQTRATNVSEKGITIPVVHIHLGSRGVTIETVNGHTVSCNDSVEATCVPVQKLSVIAEMEYNRTYCIVIRVPKGSVEDCLLYDTAEVYHYVRLTSCDEESDYLVVGGQDHAVGQEDEQEERYQELEKWTRDRFTKAGQVDYRWSGQIFEPMDFMAFIGKNSGNDHRYIVTGDSGNGLTHGVLAGKLLADLITGKENPWSGVYDPRRKATLATELPSILAHDVQINTQYKRFLQSDIKDIEDLPVGQGGVLSATGKKPIAVYKDEQGNVTRRSALCPHMGGVVRWNPGEKSWDCPIHGSRFSKDGLQIMGPAAAGLKAED